MMFKQILFSVALCVASVILLKADQGNVIRNSDFAVSSASHEGPSDWQLMTRKENISFAEKQVELKGDEKLARLVQNNLELTVGKTYELKAQVKGEGAYRIYVEWHATDKSGKKYYKAEGADWHEMSQTPQDYRLVFTYVGGTKARLSIQAQAHSRAVVSQLQLMEVCVPNDYRQLGARWKFFGNSLLRKTENGQLMVEACPVSGYRPGAVLCGMPALPGRTYAFTYNVSGVGHSSLISGYHLYMLQVDFKDGRDLLRSSWEDTMCNQLMTKTFTFKVPKDWKGKTVDIQFRLYKGSQALFSARSFLEKKIDPTEDYRLVISQPAYRQVIYASNPLRNISGYAEADERVRRIQVTMETATGVQLHSVTCTMKDGRWPFVFPASSLPEGTYVICARFYDMRNREMKVCKESLIKAPPAPVEVLVDEHDHRLRINGAPFFPLVSWACVESRQALVGPTNLESQFKYLASHGINTVKVRFSEDPSELLKCLDQIQRCNLRAIINLPHAGSTETAAFSYYAGIMTKAIDDRVKAHPALLGYFLVDEPAWCGISLPNLLASYQFMRKHDLYHPIWINEAPRSTLEDLKPYGKAADIYGVDIYPVPKGAHFSEIDDKSLTTVGKHARKLSAAVEGRKPIWMCLQGFAWGDTGGKSKLQYPTYAESRFMAYDALVNGSTALTWYGLNHAYGLRRKDTLEFFKDFFRMTMELDRMSGLFAAGNVIQDTHCAGLRLRLYELNGLRYIIALNPSPVSLDASIEGHVRNPDLQVLFEDRQLRMEQGVLRDHFEPYDVHIYAEGQLPPPCRSYRNFSPELKDDPMAAAVYHQLTPTEKLRPYEGHANWIWDMDAAMRPYSKVWFGREVLIRKPVVKAVLQASADDEGFAWLDGKELGSISGWNILKRFDVSKQLSRPGSHVFSMMANDGLSRPCGLLVELVIQYGDGSSETIVSDESWRVSTVVEPDWMSAETVRQWKHAAKQAPYGLGRWARRVRLQP